jgi:hypothetical protein
MAVFEKKHPRKVFLDDTEVLTCVFESAQNIHGHTVSEICRAGYGIERLVV